ncbi:hypothetical protein SDRG_02234 [Saprolegnia diclina VS20]|uniref:F-box domain-containing protein n=1 Tax=Saprolegnia diclina (strain VS20) TaxID=1156394 RepID=T0S597_SAPDV|nr:hypothetical protein SDRG_02234 [Saprolegnia diclina VS20]EQC40333.1 hypothetical protein SDRG_02234 [Saprolegnia diclina VS20]|eukprot:XP_008606032.1 hypothetical protein SDRG_02234 [Saprolegnia diclina VS20]
MNCWRPNVANAHRETQVRVTVQWLPPQITQEILSFLDDANDACAFLTAMPEEALDDALDALRSILGLSFCLSLWPVAHGRELNLPFNREQRYPWYDEFRSIMRRALPAFPRIDVVYDVNHPVIYEICHATMLRPTTSVHAEVDHDVGRVRAAFGNWTTSITHLTILSESFLNYNDVVEDELLACPRLRALTMEQFDANSHFGHALAVVITASPRLERLSLRSYFKSVMADGTNLLAWLARPSARHLHLERIVFDAELGTALARAMLTSKTLNTIELVDTPYLAHGVMSPSLPPLPRQLRHLTMHFDKSADVNSDLPWTFGDADAWALATKIVLSNLTTFKLRLQNRCDVTPVMTALDLIPTLTTLALETVHVSAFPHLVQLWRLELLAVTYSENAIASLATLLHAFPKLTHLDLGQQQLPYHQALSIFRALPLWLSHRGTACEVHLGIESDAHANAFATALVQMRNTHKITLTVLNGGLSLKAHQYIVAALGLTSRMGLRFSPMAGYLSADEKVTLATYSKLHRVQISKRKRRDYTETWYLSPSAS